MLVRAPMPGTIVSVTAKAGDAVKANDVLLVLESMKIKNDIVAPQDGMVKEVFVTEGQYVKRRDQLVEIEG